MAHVAAGTRTSVAAHDTDAVTDALLIASRALIGWPKSSRNKV